MKKRWTAGLVASLAVAPLLSYAAQTTPIAKNADDQQPDLSDLQQRIEALEKKDVGTTRSVTVGTSEQFGVGSDQYGEELYIIDFGLNRDLNLLNQRQFIHKRFGGFENAPRVMISGNISGAVGKNSEVLPVDEGQHESFMEGSAEVDLTGYANEDWLAYLELSGDSFGDDTGISINQAYVTVGNFDKYPLYGTVGYQYVPFGSYITNFIESTLPQNMGRTQVPAANFGYDSRREGLDFNAAAFWFNGDTKDTKEYQLNEYGLNAQVRKEKMGPSRDMAITAGASWINNLASSNGLSDQVTDAVSTTTNQSLAHYIPAYDVRLKLEKGPFSIWGEYLVATRSFSLSEFAQGPVGEPGKTIVPDSAHFEAGYSFKVFDMSTQLSAAYDFTNDALAFDLPKDQYGVSYQLAPFRNTRVTMEYIHKNDYKADQQVVYGDGTVIAGDGKQDDLFQAQLNVFF